MPEQRFRISPTGKGAIFRLKRWFYASVYSSTPTEAREASLTAWKELVSKLIEELNKRGATELPARLSLSYELGPKGEFVPLSLKMEIFDLTPKESINLSFSERVTELERERIKAQYSELLKKAKELGVDLTV
ncbi:MAG: hypothetical protein QXH26_02210 [Candidatus Hadarchaeales archaeon]